MPLRQQTMVYDAKTSSFVLSFSAPGPENEKKGAAEDTSGRAADGAGVQIRAGMLNYSARTSTFYALGDDSPGRGSGSASSSDDEGGNKRGACARMREAERNRLEAQMAGTSAALKKPEPPPAHPIATQTASLELHDFLSTLVSTQHKKLGAAQEIRVSPEAASARPAEAEPTRWEEGVGTSVEPRNTAQIAAYKARARAAEERVRITDAQLNTTRLQMQRLERELAEKEETNVRLQSKLDESAILAEATAQRIAFLEKHLKLASTRLEKLEAEQESRARPVLSTHARTHYSITQVLVEPAEIVQIECRVWHELRCDFFRPR